MTGGPIDISLMQPSFYGPAVSGAPLYIWNTLTNEIHNYSAVADVLEGRPFFDFTGWPPSVYEINNNADTVLPVVLFDNTYMVEPGSLWVFIAHDEIDSHIGWQTSGQASRIIQSYWDTSLGGSIWDGGASLWDIYTP